MKIITLSEKEFDAFSMKNKNNSYYQTSMYAKFQHDVEGYQIHYLGFQNDDNKLIGAGLMLYKTLFWGYKFAYSPRGFLIDYDDMDLITELTQELKQLLRKQKFIFIKIDPLIVASERDKDGNTIHFNNKVNDILTTFSNNKYEHLGFNLYNESVISRWSVLSLLNKDGRVLFNNFSKEVKEKITYANNMAVSVSRDNDNNLDKFYDYLKNNFTKKNKKYFQALFQAFNDKLKIFYAFIDTKKYVQNANKLYNQEFEKNKNLADIIQSGDNIKYDIQKAINDKITSDKLLNTYKKDIVASTKLLKQYPDGITCGAALTLEEAKGVCILINYEAKEYAHYNISTLLTYEIMKYFGKENYQYINLGDITGNFNPSSKYYPLLLSKIGFNSSILEYIGEFDIILKPAMYKIYKKKYKIKR